MVSMTIKRKRGRPRKAQEDAEREPTQSELQRADAMARELREAVDRDIAEIRRTLIMDEYGDDEI